MIEKYNEVILAIISVSLNMVSVKVIMGKVTRPYQDTQNEYDNMA